MPHWPRPPRRHWIYPTLTVAAVLVMVVRIVSTYHVFNDTIDEPYHIGAGVGLLEAKRHIEGTQHPPLARMIAAIPLYLSGVEYPQDRGNRTVQWDLHAFDIGHAVLMKGKLPYWSVLTRARAAMLIFPILTVLYLYWLGKYLAGALVGCLSAIALSTDPNLLAHGGLVTTDVAAAAGFLAATYHGLRFIARPTRTHAIIAGIAMGLALACKFSCVLAGVGLLLVLLTRRCRAARRGNWRAYFRAWPSLTSILISAACTFVAMWAAYFFDVGRLDQAVSLDQTLEWRGIPQSLRHLPLPMPSAILGYLTLAEHNRGGHGAYLNGQIENFGWWYYFPEAIALKSPAALVVAIACAIVVLVITRRRPRAIGAVLFPFLVFMLVSMNAYINIGIRHVLPAIPLLYLMVVWQLSRARLAPLVMVMIVAAMIETFWLHPDYLAFFNVFAGGPRGGERYLLDSNLDWGQDHWRLAQWLEQNARGQIVTDRTFGNDRLRVWPHDGYEVVPHGQPARGLFVTSKNIEHGLYASVYYDESGQGHVEPDLTWAQKMRLRPIARIGYTIDVCELDPPASPSTR